MSTATIADTPVELNDEGFFVNPEQWTESMADELARREGIDELTSAHTFAEDGLRYRCEWIDAGCRRRASRSTSRCARLVP